jgi:hypothetical protein
MGRRPASKSEELHFKLDRELFDFFFQNLPPLFVFEVGFLGNLTLRQPLNAIVIILYLRCAALKFARHYAPLLVFLRIRFL